MSSGNRSYKSKKLFFSIVGIIILSSTTHAIVDNLQYQACQTDTDCANISMSGTSGISRCMEDGRCSNPFQNGCLQALSGRQDIKSIQYMMHKRACTAQDRDDENCHRSSPSTNHAEVRIAVQNWASSIILAWIYQILLSELLDIPVTLEFGLDKEKMGATKGSSVGDFYDPSAEFIYGQNSYPFEYLKKASSMMANNEVCTSTSNENCAHILPEIWGGADTDLQMAKDEGYVHDGSSVGYLGRMGFYVPKFTVEQDPSLISYFGLRGDRRKMSETFKTPITWKQYCQDYSDCDASDEVAKRPPIRNSTDDEESSYYVEGLYTGFFVQLKENNCDINRDTCKGHFVDGSCDWTTYASTQMFYNNISLASNGSNGPNKSYTYSQMIQIWRAAQATKSNVLMWFYTPEIDMYEFEGTDAEFQRVLFPVPSSACQEYRQDFMTIENRCSLNETLRLGSDIASCDYHSFAIKKAISSAMRNNDDNENMNPLLQSPAFDFIKTLRLPSLAMDDIFLSWKRLSKIRGNGHAAREATCLWIHNNIDAITEQLPYGYPRKFANDSSTTLHVSAMIFAIVAILVISFITYIVHQWRERLMLTLWNVDILIWVLIGAYTALIGSTAVAFRISNVTCMISSWTSILGIAIQLVPIIIKIGTVNKLVREARMMRPFELNPKVLDLYFLGSVLAIVLYLVIATVIDPAKARISATIVEGDLFTLTEGQYCAHSHKIWHTIDHAICGILILIASLLVFQSRDCFEEFNEGQGLSLMVYSFFVIQLLKIIVLDVTLSYFDGSEYSYIESLLDSVGTMIAMCFYFGQKFMKVLSHLFSNNSPSPVDVRRNSMTSQRQNRGTSMRTMRVHVQTNSSTGGAAQIIASSKEEEKDEFLMNSLNLPTNSDGDVSMSVVSNMSSESDDESSE